MSAGRCVGKLLYNQALPPKYIAASYCEETQYLNNALSAIPRMRLARVEQERRIRVIVVEQRFSEAVFSSFLQLRLSGSGKTTGSASALKLTTVRHSLEVRNIWWIEYLGRHLLLPQESITKSLRDGLPAQQGAKR